MKSPEIMKNHLCIVMSTMLWCVVAAGCSGNGEGRGASVDTVYAEVIENDFEGGVADDVFAEEIAEEPDSVLTYKVSSAEEAILFMNQSADSAKYAEGVIGSIANDDFSYAGRLLRSRYNHFIIADKQSMRVTLYDRFGRQVKSYKMACSKRYGTKHKRRDNRTPEGFFTAEGVYDSTDWLYTDDDGYTSPKKGQFGPKFIRLQTAVSSQIGIHGTCAPWSVGHRASHGCMRLTNENILELVTFVEVGMPIIVNPSDRDQEVNLEEDCEVTQLRFGEVRKKVTKPVKKPEVISDTTESVAVDTAVSPAVVPDTIPVADSLATEM